MYANEIIMPETKWIENKFRRPTNNPFQQRLSEIRKQIIHFRKPSDA